MLPAGRAFYKMSGSGNDFVVVDAMREPAGHLSHADTVQSICARATGIGADGIVFLEPSAIADYRMTYLNSDGSRADLCGNASLCTARLAIELGIVAGTEFSMETDAGILGARLQDGEPEVDLQAVTDIRRQLPIRLEPGEEWIGFALVGVPHLIVRVGDVATVFFRADGSTDGIPLNERSTGPDFAVLRRTPRRICVVSGSSKLPSLRGALAARVITDLYIDAGTARELVSSAG